MSITFLKKFSVEKHYLVDDEDDDDKSYEDDSRELYERDAYDFHIKYGDKKEETFSARSYKDEPNTVSIFPQKKWENILYESKALFEIVMYLKAEGKERIEIFLPGTADIYIPIDLEKLKKSQHKVT